MEKTVEKPHGAGLKAFDGFRYAIAREGPLARTAIAAFFVAAVIYGGGKGDGGNGGGGDGGDAGGGDRGGVMQIPRPGGSGFFPSATGGATNDVFRWTSFAIDGDSFGGTLAWPATNLDDYAVIDIFHKESLTNALWRWIHREEVYFPEDLETSVTFGGDELPYWEESVSGNYHEDTNEVSAPFGVIYTNIHAYVPAATNLVAGFFRAANQHDSDGDGAPDAVETSLELDPGDPDMDGDGVPDGRELTLGSNPLLTDSDGDGLDDGVEVSWGAASTNGAALWIDTSAATNRVVLFTNTDDDCVELPMPFPLHLVGAAMTNLAVNANGLVCFSSGGAAFGSGRYNNYRAEYLPLSDVPCATVAAFWDDIQVFPEMESEVSLAVVGLIGCQTGIVEFAHVGFHDRGTSDFVSFQVQFRETETNVVRVVFSEATGLGCGEAATLGARSTCDDGVEYSFNDDGSVFPGLVVEYHFGIGTDPAKADTDDDGLDDNEEFAIGTNPLNEDTDGDGLSDYWEVGHLPFDPLDAADAAADADGDGLSNAFEILQSGTDWQEPDTDSDGLSDGEECGYVYVTAQPPFDMSSTTNVLELFDDMDESCISVALPFSICPPDAAVCSNIVIDINGKIALATDQEEWLSSSPTESRPVIVNAFADDLMAYTNELGSALSMATVGTNGVRRFVVEYRSFGFYGLEPVETNSVSFQVSFTENERDIVRVCYFRANPQRDLLSDRALGSYAEIGAETENRSIVFSKWEPVAQSGLALTYHLGTGTSPLLVDTDGDGLDDDEELVQGTNPIASDTDGDGLPDGWEHGYGLNPLNPNDGPVDSDEDGLSNVEEYFNTTNPGNPDSDGDDVNDGVEVNNGTDPNNPNDGANPPAAEEFLSLPFHVYGDYAAWEMRIHATEGDTRTFRISTSVPGQTGFRILKLRKGASYEISLRWCGSGEHRNPYWYCWEAQVGSPLSPNSQSFNDYKSSRLEGNEILVGDGWICENEEGLLTSHVHTCDGDGGNIASGKTATLHVLGGALRADLDRDGAIGATENATPASPLRVWLNNDDDSGAVQEDSVKDAPGEGSSDSGDNVVDGLSDLVDFFPVKIDFREALATINGISGIDSSKVEVRLSCDGAELGCVETDFTAQTAGKHLSDPNAGVESAAVGHVGGDGTNLTQNFISAMRQDSDKGVVLLEGKTRSPVLPSGAIDLATLTAEIRYDGECVLSASLPIIVAPVEEFYRWYNFRAICGGAMTKTTNTSSPAAPPSDATNVRNIVFVHGANISESMARGWNAEMFKRLWQSGASMDFSAIAWYSDKGMPWNYHENVSNAFVSAQSLAQTVNGLSGQSIVVAHSLGTIVAASAIQDYEMQVEKLIMLNSAIPSEAFDPSLFAPAPENQLVHTEWTDYTNVCWASLWHERFPTNDARSRLTWKDRFAGVASVAENFYSSGEDVLEFFARAQNPQWFNGFTASQGWGSRYSWQKQELYKGRASLLGSFGTTDWSGWGFAENWLGIRHWSADEANAVTDFSVFTTNAVFNLEPPSITNAVATRHETDCHLAFGIPALSPPVGRTSLQTAGIASVDMNSSTFTPNGIPSQGHLDDYSGRWLHSDIKNLAFQYTWKVFREIVIQGNLR